MGHKQIKNIQKNYKSQGTIIVLWDFLRIFVGIKTKQRIR